jgi:predicted RNA-binding protein with RPS1 domain
MRGASFGAFIQLEPSLEGLAHISQLARFRVSKVEDVLTEGMVIPVKILDIDLDRRRISLSVKEVIDLPRLTKNEELPVDLAAEGAGDAEVAEVTEALADEAGSDSVRDAVGAAFAEALSEAVSGAAAEAAASALAEEAAAKAIEDAVMGAAQAAAETAAIEDAAEAIMEAMEDASDDDDDSDSNDDDDDDYDDDAE